MSSPVLLRCLRLALAVLIAGLALAGPVQAATHVVKRGETLSAIASTYGVTVQELARANRLKDADLVKRGQKLTIPVKASRFVEHKVAKGQSLATIAARHKVTIADIRAHNTLRNPNHIVPGQILRIPVPDGAATTSAATPARSAQPAPPARANPRRDLPPAVQTAIDSAKLAPGRWKHIVIHHSGTKEGSGRGMDRYHREERRMENGLAYHFVVGNGNGMAEGSIFVGKRWTGQLDGGHLAKADLNANSLGICLVGNFEASAPTARQLDALEALVRALMRKTGLPARAVTTHRLIHARHTQCPGRHFPTKVFLKRLQQP